MKLYFRLLWLFLTQSRRSACTLLGPCDTAFRVLPTDLDILGHMNNGVYLTLMDIGRVDLMQRSNIFKKIHREGWYPVLAAESIRFRKSLRLGQKFTIQTAVVGWNEKSFFLTQKFVSGGELVAHAVVDARFLSRRGGSVPTAMLLSKLDRAVEAPVTPDWLESWLISKQAMAKDV